MSQRVKNPMITLFPCEINRKRANKILVFFQTLVVSLCAFVCLWAGEHQMFEDKLSFSPFLFRAN